MKKTLSILLIIVITLTFCVQYTSAVDIIANGNCGAEGGNVKWKITADGILTISGNGRMADFQNVFNLPYGKYKNYVETIIIEEGVTYIGDNAFFWRGDGSSQLPTIKSISIPKSVKEIGDCTFAFMTDVEKVFYNAENCKYTGKSLGYGYNYFPQAKFLIIGQSVKSIGANVFYRAAGNDAYSNTYSYVRYNGTAEEWTNVKVDYTGNEVLNKINFVPSGTSSIKILLNNKFISCDQPPVIVDGRTLVPMRAIFEALGASVSWNGDTNTATGVKDNNEISITLGKKYIKLNGEKKEIDVPAQIISSRTMIPVRAIAEAFDCSVYWNFYRRYVVITPNDETLSRVEAVDQNGNVIARGHFDKNGRLEYIYGTVCQYLTPFFININGNSNIDIIKKLATNGTEDDIINFNYDSDGFLQNIFADDIDYDFNTENAICKDVVFYDKNDNENIIEYKSENFACIIGEPHRTLNDEDMFIFNKDGLLTEYKYFSGESFKSTYEYNENGQLICETNNNLGGISYTYTYDESGKLVKCVYSTSTKPIINYEVTYEYFSE